MTTAAAPTLEPSAPDAVVAGRPAVPDHDVLRRIGRGAYGEIWLARARGTGAWRAVKIVRRENFDDERTFRREFGGLAAFEPISRSHDGFVDILQVGRQEGENGFLYYVMELADPLGGGAFDPATYRARSLRAELGARPDGRLPAAECIELGLRLAEALGALHGHGLTHRDLKPDNVIFVNGRPMLADIGLVAAPGQRSFVGTEGYVPPEGPGGESADLYALGKVLYEAAMGRDRLEFPTLPSRLGENADERRALRGLNAVLLRACAPRPAGRHRDSAEFCADLRRLQSGRTPRRAWWGNRAAAVATLAALVGAALWVVVGHRDPGQISPPPLPTPGPSPNKLAAVPAPGPLSVPPVAPESTPPLQPPVPPADPVPTARLLDPGRAPAIGMPWENTLGMRFVPLAGGGVLFGVWETRVSDFAAFVAATGYDATGGGMAQVQHGGGAPRPDASWRQPGFPQTDQHPVVGVSWKDAYAFCDWLTQTEREAGRLEEDQFYRLPTDAEWSRAVGLPPEPGTTPQARSGKVRGVFPWGTQWPPPPGAGNYAGAELRAPGADWPAGWRTLLTADGFPRTAPVGSFSPNALGVHDLGGNAWEWCEDRFAPGGETRVLRGGAWANVDAELLLASKRIEAFPHVRSDLYGFRVVLETPAPAASPAAVRAPRAGEPWENALGMRFAPVGPRLLFATWETRVGDYAAFCRETARAHVAPDFEQGADHPVVNINREDANAFCRWLTARELAAGALRAGQVYRLPTDREWSLAAGLPEEAGDTPEARDGRLRGVYPWGKTWPPPSAAGNFADPVAKRPGSKRRLTAAGFPYTQTAPVGSFTPNVLGLHDLAGNVWEWCADPYKPHGALRQWGVLRGGSWADYGPGILGSAYRNVVPAGERDGIYGFRCVVELGE